MPGTSIAFISIKQALNSKTENVSGVHVDQGSKEIHSIRMRAATIVLSRGEK